MTSQEFQTEFHDLPLHQRDVEQLTRLSAFKLVPPVTAEEQVAFEEAKRLIREELSKRRSKSERQEEVSFRRMERHRTDQQHGEHVAQSSRMHIEQMERSHASYVLHRRSIWIAATVAVLSALLAVSSLWQQRKETQLALEVISERMDALEARGTKVHADEAAGRDVASPVK